MQSPIFAARTCFVLVWVVLYSCCIVLYSCCLVFYSCCVVLFSCYLVLYSCCVVFSRVVLVFCRVVLVLCRVVLVLCRVILVLCRVVSCCARVVRCCYSCSFLDQIVLLPKFSRSSIYVITIVKFCNRPIQSLFNFPQRTSMDFFQVIQKQSPGNVLQKICS